MKSDLYTQGTIQRILERMDAATLLRELGINGNQPVEVDGELRAYCPICKDQSRMTLVLDNESRSAYCTNLACPGSTINAGGGNFVRYFATASGSQMDAAIEKLAGDLAVPLEQRSVGGDNSLSPESFQFVEVGHYTRTKDEPEQQPADISFAGQNGTGRGVYVPEAELDAFASQYRSGVFRSHFRYNISDAGEIETLRGHGRLHVLGDYYLVFRAGSSAEIVHAINQAIDVVERLKEGHGVPYDAVSVFFAGRDLEVHVDYTVFDAAPAAELPEIYRRVTSALIGIDPTDHTIPAGFSQLDMSVYRNDYLTVIPGSLVSGEARDTFKIRLSYSAFKKLSYQRLNEFTQRRPDLPPREPHAGVAPRARELYQTVAASFRRESHGGDRDAIATIFYRVDEGDGGEIATAKQLAPTLLKRLFSENRQVISTFSPHLNRTLGGGLNPGDLYVVAGFPGSGTSTFALQMMNHVAEHQNVHCVFVGLQRGIEELFKRSLSNLGQIPVDEIDARRMNPAELHEDKDFNKRIMGAYERYQQFAERIVILEGAAAADLPRLTQLIRERKDDLKSHGADSGGLLLVIDSLHLMVAVIRAVYRNGPRAEDLFGDSGSEDVRILTGRLKALARELDITVLATLEHYDCQRCMDTERTEPSAGVRELFFNTQFADTLMQLSRHGATLKMLSESLRIQLSGTPLEHQMDATLKRIGEMELQHQKSSGFAALSSEFAVLDVVKNRSGPLDKIALVFNKRFSNFEPVEYSS